MLVAVQEVGGGHMTRPPTYDDAPLPRPMCTRRASGVEMLARRIREMVFRLGQ